MWQDAPGSSMEPDASRRELADPAGGPGLARRPMISSRPKFAIRRRSWASRDAPASECLSKVRLAGRTDTDSVLMQMEFTKIDLAQAQRDARGREPEPQPDRVRVSPQYARPARSSGPSSQGRPASDHRLKADGGRADRPARRPTVGLFVSWIEVKSGRVADPGRPAGPGQGRRHRRRAPAADPAAGPRHPLGPQREPAGSRSSSRASTTCGSRSARACPAWGAAAAFSSPAPLAVRARPPWPPSSPAAAPMRGYSPS